jgi:hypothetical protein
MIIWKGFSVMRIFTLVLTRLPFLGVDRVYQKTNLRTGQGMSRNEQIGKILALNQNRVDGGLRPQRENSFERLRGT